MPLLVVADGFGTSIPCPAPVGAGAAPPPGRPDPKAVFDCIERYRPTIFFGLPTLYIALLADDSAGARNLSSIRLFISAAEPLSFETFGRWKELYGGEIVEGLGSTELLHIYLSNQPGEARVGTAGRRVPGYEIKLLDPDGNEVPKGEVGNMLVRGHSQSPGYWKQPEKTAATMRGTWIFTGDRFREDEDGFYRFAGRADELIKVSGQWIHPLEIERCLAEHPAVHECAVLGLERSDRRMTTKAFVKLRAGHARSEDVARALQNFVKERLLPYKYPRLVEFVDELPKTGTGKIDRQALRRQPSDQEGGPGPGRP
ncbi:MAG: AMP-binding protein [Pseudomonadota bacterium]